MIDYSKFFWNGFVKAADDDEQYRIAQLMKKYEAEQKNWAPGGAGGMAGQIAGGLDLPAGVRSNIHQHLPGASDSFAPEVRQMLEQAQQDPDYNGSPEDQRLMYGDLNTQIGQATSGRLAAETSPIYEKLMAQHQAPQMIAPGQGYQPTEPMQFHPPNDIRSSSAEGSPGTGPSTYRDTNTHIPISAPSMTLNPGSPEPAAPPQASSGRPAPDFNNGWSPQLVAQHFVGNRQQGPGMMRPQPQQQHGMRMAPPRPILQQRNRVSPQQANPRRGSAFRTSA